MVNIYIPVNFKSFFKGRIIISLHVEGRRPKRSKGLR